MSVVAVRVYDKKIVIAADSFIGFSYDSQLKDQDAKLFKQDKLVVGAVGYANDVQLFKLFTKTRKPSRADEDAILEFLSEFSDWCRKKKDSYRIQSDFIIIWESKAFRVSSSLYVKEIKDYASMGAGQNMAQTALHLGKSAQKAVDVACELSIYCERPVNTIEIPR